MIDILDYFVARTLVWTTIPGDDPRPYLEWISVDSVLEDWDPEKYLHRTVSALEHSRSRCG